MSRICPEFVGRRYSHESLGLKQSTLAKYVDGSDLHKEFLFQNDMVRLPDRLGSSSSSTLKV
jgi:hypothetical protein